MMIYETAAVGVVQLRVFDPVDAAQEEEFKNILSYDEEDYEDYGDDEAGVGG